MAALQRVKRGLGVDEPKTDQNIDEFLEPHELWARYMICLQELARTHAILPNTLGVSRELRDRLLRSRDMYHRDRGMEVQRALRGHDWEDIRPSIERG